jgi:hypothetical protein
METIKRAIRTLGIIGISTFILFIVTARAAEPIDCIVCQDMTMTPIVQTGDLIIMGYEAKGIVLDNMESKFWDSDTVHGVGIMKIEKGKLTGSFINKHVDPSGDFYVLEGSLVGNEVYWKFIYGTGKFTGIAGGGKSIRFTRGKPVSPGTSQSCTKVTGTYELKK